MKLVNQICIMFLIVFFSVSSLLAQDDLEDLSIQAANPLADLMSFPFQNNLNINYGPFNRNFNHPNHFADSIYP